MDEAASPCFQGTHYRRSRDGGIPGPEKLLATRRCSLRWPRFHTWFLLRGLCVYLCLCACFQKLMDLKVKKKKSEDMNNSSEGKFVSPATLSSCPQAILSHAFE